MGLPEGITLGSVLAVLIPVGVVTLLLRALPFRMRRSLDDAELVRLLGVTMPVGVMVVLVVYTMAGYEFRLMVPALISVLATLGVHIWLRRPSVSILSGTMLYMVLINVVW